MKKSINSKNYRFIINYFNSNKKFCFYIKAVHKKTLAHSFISNVNCILSALGVDGYNRKFWESEWIVTKKESNNFFKKAADFLADSSFVNYIEKQLDLDRALGEWNKIKI